MSPARSPALAAGDPAEMSVTSIPDGVGRLAWRAVSAVRLSPSTPAQAVTNLPLLAPRRKDFTMLEGMAKPMPMLPPVREKMAVLTPTSLPSRSTSAPPELPGLIEASVWMKFWKPTPGTLLRPTAETMPEVTVWPTPNGFPTATTKSPTRSASLSASGIAVRLSASIRIRATSVSGSEPTNSAFTLRPSARVTVTSSAPSITWWLVST